MGEMSGWCAFFVVISTFPKSTTFSLVKKVIVLITVKASPIRKIGMPTLLILNCVINELLFIKSGRNKYFKVG